MFVSLGEILISAPCNAQYYGGYPQQNVNNQYTGFGGTPNYNTRGAYSPAQYYNPQSVPVQTGPPGMAMQSNQQPSTMQNLERALNQVDTSGAWSHIPVSGPVNRTALAAPGYSAVQQLGYAAAQAGYAAPQPQVGMMPHVTRRDIARVFMEGGSLFGGGGGGGGASSWGGLTSAASNGQSNSTAYNSYQKAEDMAIRARNAANRTLSGDKWSKGKSADEAYYDANDAEAAADRAYNAAQSGDSQARNYASRARDAADRARADANRARYNADTAQ